MDTLNIIYAEDVIPCFPALNSRLIMAAEEFEMMRATPEDCLRQRFCRASNCGATFFVCKHCDRGQCYCSQRCRQFGRYQQRREANSRYQQTERGRLGHLLRQRIYRQKSSGASVTDHGQRHLIQPGRQLSLVPPRCFVCLQRNDWINPFDQIFSRRWRKFPRRQTGARPKKYVFS